MNSIQKQPNSGFRIVWFMFLEATISLIIISIAIAINTFVAVLLLASVMSLFIKLASVATKANVVLRTNEYSFTPYGAIIDGWKSLFIPMYSATLIVSRNTVHTLALITSIKHQKPAIKRFASV